MPEGPIRHFYERLHDLHVAAGQPSIRTLQRATRSERRPGGINPTTIHDAFAAPRLARWEVVREVVTQLGGDADEFEQLWRAARQAQSRDADLAETGAVGPGPDSPADTAPADTAPAGNADSGPVGPVRAPVPRELPLDVFAFTGRGEQLKWLDGLLPGEVGSVAIAAITGTAGVGKTALAVHWGHRVRARFPDGQLYVNLRGVARAQPMRPVEVLAQFLRSLGVPAPEIPADEDAAAARYRSLLAERRVLVVLDNAAGPAQVRPLLPASPGCLALITSRERLSGLVARDGARRLSLDVLTTDEAHQLLARVLGAEPVAAEPEAAGELARMCSYLPLALRVTAATLVDHPLRTIADHVAQLRRDSLAALDVLDDEESGVRPAFALSYWALPEDCRRLFRLLGLAPVADVAVGAAAALAGAAADTAARQLDRLAAAHLVTSPLAGRYTYHDLLRQYAAERALYEDTVAERNGAVRRLLDWYLGGADAAAKLVYPDRMRLPVPAVAGTAPAFADHAAALAWLDAERTNVVALIEHAARHGPGPTAWLLADSIRGYLWLRAHTIDLARATDAALRAAEAAGDLRAQAITLLSLANLDHRRRRYPPSITHATRALELAEQAGWIEARAAALGLLATAHRDAGQMEEAVELYGRALALYRDAGSREGEATTLSHLGRTYYYLGRIDEAIESAHQAVARYRQLGSRQGEVAVLSNLGECLHAARRLEEATEYLGRALALAREIGDRRLEAYSLHSQAAVRSDRGQSRPALEQARAAVRMAGEFGDVRIEADALNTLAAICHALGQDRDALAHHRNALDLADRTGDPFPQIVALIGIAAAQRRLGQAAEALAPGQRALDLARRTGFRILDDRARAVLRGVPELGAR